jgi:rSAM-associated Gly-rich repeat protein
MTQRNRTLDALSVLLPAGALGISMALASAPAEAVVVPNPNAPSTAAPDGSVSARLQAIRDGVSTIASRPPASTAGDALNILKTWWGNGGWGRWHGGWGNGGWGWRNGGWGNGGWRNGGWGNGGWGNGGWHNGGWPNFWHNW